MRFKILEWNESVRSHKCEDLATGRKIYLDIIVDGSLDSKMFKSDKAFNTLIGKTIECSDTHPFVSIANNVKIL